MSTSALDGSIPRASALRRMRGCLRWRWRGLVRPAVKKNVAPVAAATASMPDRQRIREMMHACVDGGGGEVSARARVGELARFYKDSNSGRRALFLDVLARDFDVETSDVVRQFTVFANADSDLARAALLPGLRAALEPPRQSILRQLNRLPDGIKILIDLRADLMASDPSDPALHALERELRAMLANWPDVSFLQLRRLTWDNPAAILEKLIRYEAVHEIRGWQDLKNRLDADRRCFAFFHPYMPDEPLAFVEVALVRGMAGNIQALLDENAPM